ncbi:MAG: hypothetical protein JNL68_15700 [Burkholderiales bacterium]|nr:hypothetical protein [Burkholderiales bacterium]
MKRTLPVIALALFLAPPLDIHARDKGERSGADAAAERARRDTGGGRVLSVRPPPQQENGDYRVKILTPQGEVRYLNVDPRQDPGRK